MTLEEYSKNPMGQKNALFSQRDMYRKLYTEKFDKLLLRENGKFQCKLYMNNDKYYIYLKIPSEVINDFYYDVVIELYTKNPIYKMNRNLNNYDFKCYSNSPDYVFTFAHAMIKNNMFINDLKPKMSKLAIDKVAKERNPKNQIGYIKGLYFAYLYIKKMNLLAKISFEANGEKYDKKILLDQIMHADEKIALRQQRNIEKEKKDKLEKKKTEMDNANIRTDVKPTSNVKKSNFIKKVNNIKKTAKINTTKKTKTTKKI